MSPKIQAVVLPDYTKKEELLNSLSHAVGACFGVMALVLNLCATFGADSIRIITGVLYALTIITTYTVSAIYHGLPIGDQKRLWRVIDHCAIYLLIVGTYTPIVLVGMRALSPFWGWLIFALECGIAAFAILLNILDLKKYSAISMVCYIFLGWCIALNLPLGIEALTPTGFGFVLAGGIVYTIGAVLYGVGKHWRYIHTLFHVFTVAAAVLQYIGVYRYILLR